MHNAGRQQRGLGALSWLLAMSSGEKDCLLNVLIFLGWAGEWGAISHLPQVFERSTIASMEVGKNLHNKA